jgi:polyhydroxyalkanoate synthesis regulator phasin
MDHRRVLEQLDRMVTSGRITQEEANKLRAADGTTEFDEVMTAIRVRHAQAHTDAAVAAGTLSQEDAAAALESIRQGDHSGDLRRRIRGRG